MKVSIINGSPRKNGATAKILQEIQKVLKQKGDVEVVYVDLSELNMKYCIGCIHCYKSGHCVIRDDGVEELAAQVKQSDGIIIGSPTYGSNMSGHLKNFMDRGHFIVDQSLHNKYGFAVATYEIAEGKIVLGMLRKFFAVAGGTLKGEFLHKLDFNSAPLAKPRAKRALHRQIERFYTAIRNKERKSLFERVFNHIVVQILWKPIFLSQARKYEAVLQSWRQKGLLETEKGSFLSPILKALF